MTDEPKGDGVSLTSTAHPDPIRDKAIYDFAEELFQAGLKNTNSRGRQITEIIMRMIEWHWDRMNSDDDLSEGATEQVDLVKLFKFLRDPR